MIYQSLDVAVGQAFERSKSPRPLQNACSMLMLLLLSGFFKIYTSKQRLQICQRMLTSNWQIVLRHRLPSASFLGAETNTTTSQKAFLNEENCHFFGQMKLDPLLPEMSKEVFGFNLMGMPFLTELLLLLR